VAIARYVGVRLLFGVVTLLLISIVTFLSTNVVPLDTARIALGREATPAELAAFREQQGLNEPVLKRYVTWLGDAVRGDWGVSTLTRRSVKGEVVPKISRTIVLGAAAILVAVPLAFLIGIYTGQRSGKPSDVAISITSLLVASMPEFVIGLVLLVVLAVELGVLPVESSAVAFGSGAARVKAYVLPALTLTLVYTPYMIRMVRVNVRDALGEPFVRSAVLRGLSHRSVTWRHVAPRAGLPLVNVVALSMAELIGGLVVVEVVFGFPGLGKLLVESVQVKDIPMVQAVALIVGAGYVVLNLIADAVVLLLNPRLRTG
jgi:peptide/nickel transport system permease protein